MSEQEPKEIIELCGNISDSLELLENVIGKLDSHLSPIKDNSVAKEEQTAKQQERKSPIGQSLQEYLTRIQSLNSKVISITDSLCL